MSIIETPQDFIRWLKIPTELRSDTDWTPAENSIIEETYPGEDIFNIRSQAKSVHVVLTPY